MLPEIRRHQRWTHLTHRHRTASWSRTCRSRSRRRGCSSVKFIKTVQAKTERQNAKWCIKIGDFKNLNLMAWIIIYCWSIFPSCYAFLGCWYNLLFTIHLTKILNLLSKCTCLPTWQVLVKLICYVWSGKLLISITVASYGFQWYKTVLQPVGQLQ